MARITDTLTDGSQFIRHDNWIEVKPPELFKFDAPGDSLEGMLLDLSKENINQDSVLTMRFELPGGDQVKVRPSFDLQQKIGRRHLGRRLLIVYDRDDQSTAGKGNAMKIFKVFVAPLQNATPAPQVITDNDLPPEL